MFVEPRTTPRGLTANAMAVGVAHAGTTSRAYR
jgi:hypothetical protein